MSDQSLTQWIEDLSHERWNVRRAAAEALGQSGAAEAVQPLAELLEREEWKMVRLTAVEALGRLGDPRGVPALVEALQDLDRDVRQAAAEALGKIGDPQAAKPLLQVLRETYGHLMRDDVNDLNGLVNWIEELRERVCETLGQLGEGAVETLLGALQDKHWWVRQAAAEALGHIGDPRAVGPLRALTSRWRLREKPVVKATAQQAVRLIEERLQGREWLQDKDG